MFKKISVKNINNKIYGVIENRQIDAGALCAPWRRLADTVRTFPYTSFARGSYQRLAKIFIFHSQNA